MPDIFLRQGAASPNDIILRDPASAGSAVTGICATAQEPQTESGTGSLTFMGLVVEIQAAQDDAAIGSVAAPSQSQSHGGPGLVIRDRWKRKEKARAPVVLGIVIQVQGPQQETGRGTVQQVVKGAAMQIVAASHQRACADISYEARNERELIELLGRIA